MFYSHSLSSALCYVYVEKQKIRGIEEGKTPNISVLTGQQGVMVLLRLYSFKDDFFFKSGYSGFCSVILSQQPTSDV